MVKNDKLDALIMLSGEGLIEKNVSLYKNTDTSTMERPKSLDRRVQRNINKEKSKQEFGPFYKQGRRFVAALLIVCTLSFAAVMSVDAAREAVWNAIIEFFDEYLSISFFTETKPPNTIEETKKLFYEREAWEKQVVLDSKSMRSIVYRKNGIKVVTYSQGLLGEYETWFDNENTDVENIEICGISALLMFRVDQQTYALSWSDGVYEYSLETHTPEVSKEELILMAETIK